MSAIKNADRIVFIDKGQVVEDGTHSELIALKRRYYEMVKSTHHDLEESNEAQVDDEKDTKHIRSNSRIVMHEFSKDAIEEELSSEQDRVQYWKSFKRILSLLKPDWIIVTIAIIAAVVLGFSLPIFSVIFSEVYAVKNCYELRLSVWEYNVFLLNNTDTLYAGS